MSIRAALAGRQRGQPSTLAVLGAWLVLLAIAVAAMFPFRSDANVGAIVLVMLLPPLVATRAGPLIAGAAAIATGLAFNFFFTHPYDSPRIASSASIAAFIVYLVVAVTVAVFAASTREARVVADRRARDAIMVQKITVELIRNAELVPTIRSALAEVVSALGLVGAALHAEYGSNVVAASAGEAVRSEAQLARLADRHDDPPTVVALREPGAPAAFPLVTTSGALGFLIADCGDQALGTDRERVLESVTGVIALSMERARLAEEGLRRQALEETDRLRNILVQSVSHDLRTPLTAIKASASALRAGRASEEGADAMLADIEEEADRLESLVTSLLDLSRIESGALKLSRERLPVDDLVYGALQAAALGADQGRVDVDLGDDPPVLEVDETLLRQVIVNLLRNAVHHDPGPIRVTGASVGGRVELRVIDHGPGIPEAERHRIFESYNRLRPGLRGSGTGLGLAISRGFVEAHGGTIRAEPTPGGGATFVVSLPMLARSVVS